MADHTKREIERRAYAARIQAGEFTPRVDNLPICDCGKPAKWHDSRWSEHRHYCESCVPQSLIPIATLDDVNKTS